MSASNIEWTDDTWNPTVGCTKTSPGCKHCYAKTMHARLTAMGQRKYAAPFEQVRAWPDDLDAPLHWRKPRRVFVNSMSDLFHEDLPDEYIAAVFAVMAMAPRHTFQVLTKRAERLHAWFDRVGHVGATDALHALAMTGRLGERWKQGDLPSLPTWPLPNVWIGVSVEDEVRADERIPHLLNVPAAVRFLSCEPLLGPLDLTRLHDDEVGARWNALAMGIGWVIVGGESGHGARPFDLVWARSLIAQCRAASVPVFMKQIGDAPIGNDGNVYRRRDKGGDPETWADELRVREWPAVQQ